MRCKKGEIESGEVESYHLREKISMFSNTLKADKMWVKHAICVSWEKIYHCHYFRYKELLSNFGGARGSSLYDINGILVFCNPDKRRRGDLQTISSLLIIRPAER